jgi:glycosyltransferase involved in cell wall biosynthesis
VVCVSRDAAKLSAEEGIAPRKICTVRNGIDVSLFSFVGPQAKGPAVMVGRLCQDKDVETLVRAVALVAPDFPAFRLVVAGDGECLPPLKRLTAELLLEEQVRFLGEVRDIPALLAGASLFVLPSVTEGISLTLLEAMARGLPVVATDIGGNPEVVLDGQTGFLAPPRQPHRLSERIVQLLMQPQLAMEMGRQGRQRVMTHFTASQMVTEYEVVYYSALRRRAVSISARPFVTSSQAAGSQGVGCTEVDVQDA